MHIYSPKKNLWVCTMLLTCMVPGLTIWHWTTNWCAGPGEGYLPCSRVSSFAYSSLCHCPAPLQFVMVSAVLHVSSHLGSLSGRLHRCSFWCCSQQSPRSSDPYSPPTSGWQCSLSSSCRMFCSCLHWGWTPQLCMWLVVVSCSALCGKETFLGEDWWLPLPVGIMTNFVDCC